MREGVPLIERLLEAAAADPATIPRRSSRTSRAAATTSAAEIPDDGRIDWSRPAQRIVDLVRAADYSPVPVAVGAPARAARREPELGS